MNLGTVSWENISGHGGVLWSETCNGKVFPVNSSYSVDPSGNLIVPYSPSFMFLHVPPMEEMLKAFEIEIKPEAKKEEPLLKRSFVPKKMQFSEHREVGDE